MLSSSRLAAFAAASTLTLTAAPAASAADPVPWGTGSGLCNNYTGNEIRPGTQQVARPAGVARITFSGSADVTWMSTRAGLAGGYPYVWTQCPSYSTSWQATFYDTPAVPTSISGRTTFGGGGELPVTIPYDGQYVADVTLDQGAITFGRTTLASSGRVDLGTLRAGGQSFSVVTHAEGPPTNWAVRISALPVVLSAVKADSTYARSGEIVKLGYTVSGDTHVTATVTNAANVPVRALANGLAADMGERSLTWDARGAGGQSLADGVYTLTVTSTDAQGAVSAGAAQITVDNGAPVATLTTPHEVLPTQDVIVTVIDASSGVDQVAREIDPTGTPDQDPFGYSYGERPAAGPVQFTVEAPYSGWTLGRHVLRVYSSDKAGNTTHQDLAFTASATAGQRSRSSTTWKACGSIRSRAIYRLRTARGPSCTIAKRVARRANRHRRAQVSGYACSRTSKTYTCRRASKLIRWNRS